jgi:uncharacterized protein DUF4197
VAARTRRIDRVGRCTRPVAALAVVFTLALLASPARAQLDQLLRGLPQVPGSSGSSGTGLSEQKVGAGLKQALEVATGSAVNLTGRVDGYFANQAIKILMPERLRSLERGLRTVGMGNSIDEFVLSMNRAAERAAPSAKQIFLDAIGAMTFDDARKILNGSDTAATEYFKGKTTEPLTKSFQPVVSKAMDDVGVTHQYKELVGQAQSIPFLQVGDFDLDHYVVGKALDGLFVVVGEQEKKIRSDPAARASDLLREVFGSRGR